MTFKAPLVFGCLIAIALPAGSVDAGGRRNGSFSRATAARSAPQRASFRSAGAGFRNAGAGFQRSRNWAGNTRFNSSSSANFNRSAFTTNRLATNSTGTNWNRFNRNTSRFGSNWNGSNRWNGSGANRWNWRHRHHRGCDNNFVFFGSFGFPFFSAWDYGYYYPSAYYPYYPSTPYYYDPYTYYNNGGYSAYVNPGYDNGTDYDPNYDNSDRYRDSRRYDRSGARNGSTVARVQEALAREGYYKGAIDGVAGSRTFYAIRSYQRDHNLTVDGEINDQLLGEMGLR